ncbi:MAG: hypothetical protein ACREWE_00165 [Gammaproteobacteria bacterium]
MNDTPELEPRYERFRLTYPSGTVVESYYGPDGADLEEVRVAHPLATVEPVEASLRGLDQ